jgi:hypothetical protein
MNEKFLDHNLKADKDLYGYVCIPLRITIGFLFLINVIPQKFLLAFAILLFITSLGLAYKLMISGNSWKNYSRAIITYLIITYLIVWNMKYNTLDTRTVNMSVGILLITDALAGIQTKHIFNKLS